MQLSVFPEKKRYKDRYVSEWKGVFIDKCSVEESKDSRTVWVLGTPQEKYLKYAVNRVIKGHGLELMVWTSIFLREGGEGVQGQVNPIIEKLVDRFHKYTQVL